MRPHTIDAIVELVSVLDKLGIPRAVRGEQLDALDLVAQAEDDNQLNSLLVHPDPVIRELAKRRINDNR